MHNMNVFFDSAADRTWTGTDVTPRDFKSLVSADSTTAAYLIFVLALKRLYNYTTLKIKSQYFFENFF